MLFNNRRFDGEYSEISWLLSNYKQDQYLIVDSYTKYVQFKNEIETKYVQLKQGNETTTLDQYTKDFFQQYSLVCAISYNAEWAYPVYVKEKEETVYIKICKEANEER